jgi:hypothetical protein
MKIEFQEGVTQVDGSLALTLSFKGPRETDFKLYGAYIGCADELQADRKWLEKMYFARPGVCYPPKPLLICG